MNDGRSTVYTLSLSKPNPARCCKAAKATASVAARTCIYSLTAPLLGVGTVPLSTFYAFFTCNWKCFKSGTVRKNEALAPSLMINHSYEAKVSPRPADSIQNPGCAENLATINYRYYEYCKPCRTSWPPNRLTKTVTLLSSVHESVIDAQPRAGLETDRLIHG